MQPAPAAGTVTQPAPTAIPPSPSPPAGERVTRRPVVLGAIKTVLGHAEAAAGAVGVLKALLVLRRQEVRRATGPQWTPWALGIGCCPRGPLRADATPTPKLIPPTFFCGSSAAAVRYHCEFSHRISCVPQ